MEGAIELFRPASDSETVGKDVEGTHTTVGGRLDLYKTKLMSIGGYNKTALKLLWI